MAILDPFDALSSFQQALDAYRTSSWLDSSVSGGGGYPPVNVFRKADDFIIIAELPGVKKIGPRRPGEGPHHPRDRRENGGVPGKGGGASARAARRPVRPGPRPRQLRSGCCLRRAHAHWVRSEHPVGEVHLAVACVADLRVLLH